MKKFFYVLPVVILLAIGCNSKAQKADKAEGGETLVKAGEVVVSLSDVNKFLETLPAMHRAQFTMNDEARQNFIKQLTDTAILANAARGEKLDETAEYRFTVNQVLASLYYKKKMDEIKVTDEDAKKYYEENPAEFTAGQVKASHILVKTKEEADPIHAELLKDPTKFEELAKSKSTCPSASKGGDLGWFGRGRMVKEFEDVAFAQEKGALSAPIQTRFGWHIIRTDEKTEEAKKPLEEVKEQIKTQLLGKKQEEWLKTFVEEQKKTLKVEVNDAAAKKIGEGLEQPEMPAGHGMPPAPPSGGGGSPH